MRKGPVARPFVPAACRSGGLAERAVLIILDCLLDLLARVHHERAVLDNRFTERLGGQQQHACALRPGVDPHGIARVERAQIGIASCRERVCQYVEDWGVAVYLKKKKTTI